MGKFHCLLQFIFLGDEQFSECIVFNCMEELKKVGVNA